MWMFIFNKARRVFFEALRRTSNCLIVVLLKRYFQDTIN